MREAVQRIGTDGCCAGDLSERHNGPRSGKSNDGKLMLQSLTIENLEGISKIMFGA